MARRSIAGSRVLVTGASSGIGRALALELARAGAHLVVVARRADKLRELIDEMAPFGGRALAQPGDITEPAVRAQALELAERELGGLDILVNNAGIGARGPFADANPDRLRRIMEVNFFALAEMTRQALPLLKNGRRPIVVNVGSILGHRGIPLSSEYCASKFAVQGFSESLRAELSPLGIDVLVVNPGTTDTEFFQHLIEDRGRKRTGRRGVSAERVAAGTLSAIRRGKHEIIPNRKGRLLCWLNRLSPRLTDFILERFG